MKEPLKGNMTKQIQDNITPHLVLADLMAGNARFADGKITEIDIPAQRDAVKTGQFPKAVILSCLDSRVPVEMIFDQGFGDIFVGRVAGNIESSELLGSMEFATKLAGAKLVMVLGHSHCGAVKGACDGAEMGHLTELLAKIMPAVNAVKGHEAEGRNSQNDQFVADVVEQNVRITVTNIRKKSNILRALEEASQIMIVGGVYDLETGIVTFIK